MGLLTQMNFPGTTLLHLLDDADQRAENLAEYVHLELKSGRDFMIAVVTGPNAERVARLLDRLKDEEEE